MSTSVKTTLVYFIVAATTVPAGMTLAQTFPSKSLRIVVPFGPGFSADILGRVLAESMAKGLGQSVIVENRPGAGAVVGYELVARAPADGHTILQVWPSFVINPGIRSGLLYHPINDFKAVGQAISLPMAIAVHPSVPAKSLKELIALARARPGELTYGHIGAGTLHHLVGEIVKGAAKIDITHVPYQRGVVTALAGGHVPLAVANVADIAPFATMGKVRALVVTTSERAEAFPDVPTFREVGYPQLTATNWAGFVVPGATPPSAITRLNAELIVALGNAQLQERLKVQSMITTPGTPEQFAALLQSESARFAKVVQQAGIKLD